ncbi:MAG: hypothetical protein KDL87_08180 [Verrucomicrobiae bacterium]|nr:hypothetical protein [Verrucomicrobiae bacterium]
MKKLLLSAVIFGFLAAGAAQAQQVQVKVEIKKIEVSSQKTPNFQAGDVSNKNVPKPKEWLEAEVSFGLESAPRGAVVPELDFRYYVAVRGSEGAKYLTGDVKHVNLVPDRELFSVAYVSPATIGKITGEYNRVSANDILVAVEVSYQGRIVAESSSGGPDGWWRGQATEPGVLAKNKTPFALLWLDRYPDVEEGR